MAEIATKKAWKNFSIENPVRVEIDLHFTMQEYTKLIQGRIPLRMEDNWFVYHDQDSLYFHRSWTGDGVYKAKLTKERNGYSIKEFWVNRSSDAYKKEKDIRAVETFTFLIKNNLLQEE